MSFTAQDIYVALAVVIITFLISVVIFIIKKFRKPINVVLLTGLSDSGKTAIFSKIIFNKFKKSVTSLKENEATIKELNLKLIDLPGADRLRESYWEQYRSEAQHVFYIIDSTTVDAKIRDLGEYLYTLLSDGVVHKGKTRLTIACNKQDLDGALSKENLKHILEKELNAIRATKKGRLGKTSNEEKEDYLAARQEEFLTLGVNLIETSIHNLAPLIKTIF